MALEFQAVEERIHRGFEAWNRGDFDGWLANTTPDFEYGPGIVVERAAGEPVVYRGREELRGFFDEWHSQWEMEVTINEVEDAGNDRVLVFGRARMTGVQSGVTVEQEVAWLGEGEEDRLRRLQAYPSHQAAREAAGA